MRMFRCRLCRTPSWCLVGTQREDALWPPYLAPHFLGAQPPECITETHVALSPTTHKASWGASPAGCYAAAGDGGEGGPFERSLPACWKQPSLPRGLALPPSSILSEVMSPQSVALLGALIRPDGSAVSPVPHGQLSLT